MKKFWLTRMVPMVMLGMSCGAMAAPDPLAIMKTNEANRRTTTTQSKAELKTAGGSRKPSTKKFSFWRKLQKDGVRFQSLTKFHEPAEVRNEAILFVEGDQGKNEILLYLPAYKKTRRVEGQQQSSSFMSSDFTYSDITTPHVDDYTYSYKKEEPCPGPDKAGSCHVIESKPANDDIKERTGYAKATNWVRKDTFMTDQVEYYNDSGLVKRLVASNIKKMSDGKYFTHNLRMNDLKKSQFTTIVFADVKTGEEISDRLFNKQTLGQ